MNYSEKLLEKINIETIKLEIIKTVYSNQGTFLSNIDTRILLIWYMFFAIVPWFIHNTKILIGFFIYMLIITFFAKISKLVVFLLSLSIISELGSILVVSFFFKGSIEGILVLLVLTCKIVTIALASVSVFASVDPEKLSDALLSFGMPENYSFSISYGYRVLPVMIEEYNNIFNS